MKAKVLVEKVKLTVNGQELINVEKFEYRNQPRRLEDADLLALTLHRPWDWAILEGHKPVENRKWPPPQWLIGKRLAIHSGLTYDEDGADWIQLNFGHLSVPEKAEMRDWAGHIVGLVTLTGFFKAGQLDLLNRPRGRDAWAFGPWCWEVSDPVKLQRPVRVRGAQKLWRVPDDALAAIRRQVAA